MLHFLTVINIYMCRAVLVSYLRLSVCMYSAVLVSFLLVLFLVRNTFTTYAGQPHQFLDQSSELPVLFQFVPL